MKISNIIIKNRFRKELGDLEELRKSIQEIGLLHPIVVNEKDVLIAGQRRFEACKQLGWKDIPVTVVNFNKTIVGEFEENVVRKDFALSEKVAIYQAMESFEHKGKLVSKSDTKNMKRRQRAAKLVGISTDTLSKAKQVVDSNDKRLIKEMDSTGKVNRIYRKLKRQQENDKVRMINNRVLPEGIKFINDDFRNVNVGKESIDAIVTDPPYEEKYLQLWQDLADFAERVLKPSGFLIAYSGQTHLPKVMDLLSTKLTYYWIMALYHRGGTQIVGGRNMMCLWKPILVYQKPPFKKLPYAISDFISSEKREKKLHDWQQSESGVRELVERFTEEGYLVLDPFSGSGTFPIIAHNLKRKAIGIEVDESAFKMAVARV